MCVCGVGGELRYVTLRTIWWCRRGPSPRTALGAARAAGSRAACRPLFPARAGAAAVIALWVGATGGLFGGCLLVPGDGRMLYGSYGVT